MSWLSAQERVSLTNKPVGAQGVAPSFAASKRPAPDAGTAEAQPVQKVPRRPSEGNTKTVEDLLVVEVADPTTKDVVVRTLVGEYVKKGMNHDRPVFQKKHAPNLTDTIDVILYYWDARDGTSFQGWWFGNKLGGTKVWSHCKDQSPNPPENGWKIPWDGSVWPGLTVRSLQAKRRNDGMTKLDEIASKCAEVEESARQLADNAVLDYNTRAEDPTWVKELYEAEKSLSANLVAVSDLLRDASTLQKTALLPRPCQALVRSLQAAHNRVSGHFAKIKSIRQEVEQTQKQNQDEAHNARLLEDLQSAVLQEINAAVDLVQKAKITAELIETCQDDVVAVQEAVGKTEASVAEAQIALRDAAKRLNGKVVHTSDLHGRGVGETVAQEIEEFRKQLKDAQDEIEPLKNIRRMAEQRRAAAGYMKQILEKIAGAELEAERAATLVQMLGQPDGASPDVEVLREASQAMATAQGQTNAAIRFYEGKQRTGDDILKQELAKVAGRVEALREQVGTLQAATKEATDRSAANSVATEVAEKIAAAAEHMARLESHIEAADESQPSEVSTETLKQLESEAAHAVASITSATTFLQTRAVKLKRVASAVSDPLQDQKMELDAMSTQLAGCRGKLQAMQRRSVIFASELRVAHVEEGLARIYESTSVLSDTAQVEGMAEEEIRDLKASGEAAEQETSDRLMEARRILVSMSSSLRSLSSGAHEGGDVTQELQARLAKVRTELLSCRRVFNNVESQIATKRILAEVRLKLESVEEQAANAVSPVSMLVESGNGEVREAAAEKEADAGLKEAHLATRMLVRQLESNLRTHTSSKDPRGSAVPLPPRAAEGAFEAMLARAKAAEDSVDGARRAMLDCEEQRLLRGLAKDASEKLAGCKSSLGKATDAESSAKENSQSKELVSEFDKTVQQGNVLATQCKSFASMKRLSLRVSPNSPPNAAQANLDELQTFAEDMLKKLALMRIRCTELKRAAAIGA